MNVFTTDEDVKKLRVEITERGDGVYRDKSLLSGLVSDIFYDNEPLRKTLLLIIGEGSAAVRLLDLPRQDDIKKKMGVGRLMDYLADVCGFERSRAAEAVHVLLFGLGITLSLETESSAQSVNAKILGHVADTASCAASFITQGAVITLGKQHWQVLDTREDSLLVLSDRIIGKGWYHKKKEPVTWAESAMRRYLNTEFLSEFPEHVKNRLIETQVITPDNSWFPTVRGGDVVRDYIFLLSLDEIVSYFGDSGKLRRGSSDSRSYIDDIYNDKRVVVDNDDSPMWWWLRSPGDSVSRAACVDDDGAIGVFGESVHGENKGGGIRPAMWIDTKCIYKR